MFKSNNTFAKIWPYLLIVCGTIGLFASSVLTVEKIALLKDPSHYSPSCNINPILSCVSVANSPQASVFFGVPNMLFGVIAFTVVITIGVVILAGGNLKFWFWRWFNLGLLLGIIFIHWLISQSIYAIGALCIYCMCVWLVTAGLFWYTTLYNIQSGALRLPGYLKKVGELSLKYHDIVLMSWCLLIIVLIVQHFWFYFSMLV